jgi:hypothetical protein
MGETVGKCRGKPQHFGSGYAFYPTLSPNTHVFQNKGRDAKNAFCEMLGCLPLSCPPPIGLFLCLFHRRKLGETLLSVDLYVVLSADGNQAEIAVPRGIIRISPGHVLEGAADHPALILPVVKPLE